MLGIFKKTIVILVCLLSLVIGGYFLISDKKKEPIINNQGHKKEEEWENIHSSFKNNSELIVDWTKRGFSYEDAKEWIGAGIKPWEVVFVGYLLSIVENSEGVSYVDPTWISKNDRKKQMWKEWKQFRLNHVPQINKISSIRTLMSKDCQRQVYNGDEKCNEIISSINSFTLRDYKDFLKNQNSDWEYYELWSAYLEKWQELENN